MICGMGFAGAKLFGAFSDFRNWYSPGVDIDAEVMVHPMYGTPQVLSLQGPLTDSGGCPISEQRDYYKMIGTVL